MKWFGLLIVMLVGWGLWAQPGMAGGYERQPAARIAGMVGASLRVDKAAAQAGPTATAAPTPEPIVQEPTRQIPLGVSSLIGLAFLALAAWLNRRAKRT